jgi:hypothetical protein
MAEMGLRFDIMTCVSLSSSSNCGTVFVIESVPLEGAD